jgi:polyhydroxybutyrate depolymerase
VWLPAAVVALALLAAGCGGSRQPAGPRLAALGSATTALGAAPAVAADTPAPEGSERPAPVIHVPAGLPAGAHAPLVIALHASGGTPASFETKSGWDAVADRNRFIVAYLGSAAPAWKDPSNVSYIASEIAAIERAHRIDRNRIYVTGFSAGGYISYFAGCRLGATIAAIGVVSAGMRSQRCAPPHPVSELTLIGTHDIIPLTGTARFPSQAAVASLWRGIDGCGSRAPRVSTVGPVTERVWGPCAKGTGVALYILAGGVHEYPGGSGLARSSPDAAYSASEAVWAFFAAHPRRP